MQALYWTGCWAIAGGSGNPFMWTVTVNGLGYRDVVAEASVAKVQVTGQGGAHAKATVLAAYYGGYTHPWGIDGAPMRYLPNVGYMTFALQVAGPSTYAWMNGKVHVY